MPEPQCILDRKKTIAKVKVQCKHFGPDESTWELEDAMKHAYHFLFTPVHRVFAENKTPRVVFL